MFTTTPRVFYLAGVTLFGLGVLYRGGGYLIWGGEVDIAPLEGTALVIWGPGGGLQSFASSHPRPNFPF